MEKNQTMVGSQNTVQSQPEEKNEAICAKVDRLREVLDHMDKLISRVCDNPPALEAETRTDLRLSLAAVLTELPQRLDEFVDTAQCKLEEIERLIF
jgi:hypothetical protein